MRKALLIPLFFCLSLLIISQVRAYDNPEVLVGTYVYTWYDISDPNSWSYPKITDLPVLGQYNSTSNETILTQLTQIQEAGIDFALLNWLGVGTFSDTTVGEWFRLAKENCSRVKLAIMVEPYNETTDGYNFTEIYDRAYSLYSDYEAQSLMLEGKPVIYFYNGNYLTGDPDLTLPINGSFTVLTVGHRKYVDVWYDDIRNYVPDLTPHGDTISVLPRFDDFWQYTLGLRDHTDTIDRYLTEGLYSEQWERAIEYAKDNSIRYIYVATWNEYPERTAIEPHYDNTATDTDPEYLLDMTRDYINELHGLTDAPESVYWYQNPLVFGVIFLGLIFGVWLIRNS